MPVHRCTFCRKAVAVLQDGVRSTKLRGEAHGPSPGCCTRVSFRDSLIGLRERHDGMVKVNCHKRSAWHSLGYTKMLRLRMLQQKMLRVYGYTVSSGSERSQLRTKSLLDL